LPQVIPVGDDKQPRVSEHHGRDALPVTRAMIADWSANGLGDSGIAVVLPERVICLDVDDYAGHHGGATLDRLSAELGTLPATIRSTARWGLGSGRSGIRWLAIGAEFSSVRWPGKAGPGLDIIVAANRYVIVPPTMHAGVGAPYRWFDEATGRELHAADLDFAALPELPARWAEFLARGPAAVPVADVPDIRAWLESNGAGLACAYLAAITDHYITEIREAADGGGIHDSGAEGVNAVLGEMASGHPGALAEIARMRKVFVTAIAGRSRERARQAEAEWARLVTNDAPKIAARGIADEHPCELSAMEFRPRYSGEVTLAAFPGYPVNAIDGPLRELLEIAGHFPAALLGGTGLGALAGLAANAALIMPDGSAQRPSLWIPLVSSQGGSKSPVMAAALGSLDEFQNDQMSGYRRELARWNAAPAKTRGQRPVNPSWVADDFTIEKLARIMDRNGGSVLVASDELSGFLEALSGRYSGGQGDAARIMTTWSGRPWNYERVKDDVSIYIPHPVVTIVGGIQHSRLNLLGKADDSGFRSRWIPHVGPLDDRADWADAPPDMRAWDNAVAAMFDIRDDRRSWTMSERAERAWREAGLRWKDEAYGGEVNVTVSGALVKADQNCARIALVLAESEWPGRSARVPERVMGCAIAITDYVLGCWRAMDPGGDTGLTPADEKILDHVRALRDWLDKRQARGGEIPVPVRQAHRAGLPGMSSMKRAKTVAREYGEQFPGCVWMRRSAVNGSATLVLKPPERDLTESGPSRVSRVRGR
jgi:hypothetical protein